MLERHRGHRCAYKIMETHKKVESARGTTLRLGARRDEAGVARRPSRKRDITEYRCASLIMG